VAAFAAVEGRLRAILEPYRDRLETGTIYNREILRRPGGRGHDWFAGVVPNKNYVSFYMLPIYTWPQLLDGMSPALRKRKQGASCFNFSAVDEDLMAELAALTERSFQAYMSGGASLAEASPATGLSETRR
jgi:hypothetical protein